MNQSISVGSDESSVSEPFPVPKTEKKKKKKKKQLTLSNLFGKKNEKKEDVTSRMGDELVSDPSSPFNQRPPESESKRRLPGSAESRDDDKRIAKSAGSVDSKGRPPTRMRQLLNSAEKARDNMKKATNQLFFGCMKCKCRLHIKLFIYIINSCYHSVCVIDCFIISYGSGRRTVWPPLG